MRLRVSRVSAFVFILAASVFAGGASVGVSRGLDTVVRDFPRRAIDVRRMVEVVAGQCGLQPVLADEVCGELSVERVPATARSILDSTLPRMGFLYLVEGETLYVMPEKDLRTYFQTRAVSRTYSAHVTGGLLRALLETPDVVSTMGFLGIDPERGIVHINDLPSFADRVEDILVVSTDNEVLVTL